MVSAKELDNTLSGTTSFQNIQYVFLKHTEACGDQHDRLVPLDPLPAIGGIEFYDRLVIGTSVCHATRLLVEQFKPGTRATFRKAPVRKILKIRIHTHLWP